MTDRKPSGARNGVGMIGGVHAIIFCEDAHKAREFFRGVLGFPSVDAGGGWLIFKTPPAEIAMHPEPGFEAAESRHELFFMCHDIEKTIDDLESKGVEFVAPVSEQNWGLLTRFRVPGAGEIGLYQPKHPSLLRGFETGR